MSTRTKAPKKQYAGPSVPIQKSSLIGLSPALREIKQQLEQFAEGKLQRPSHLDQSEPSSVISLRRIGVCELMSCASFSSGDFASPTIGYLGPSETTPYYPTPAILNEIELSPLLSPWIRSSSLITSDTPRLDLASMLSLRANILCDLKRNDDSIDTAVMLCKEHRDSLNIPVPEVAYALLNHALLLCSFGLGDEGSERRDTPKSTRLGISPREPPTAMENK
ncbi:hypothetical protein BGW80DRAFT_1457795 [Lactifluus volemus]|nr:hypothetical protein BGW80DRAFT_1457795 [Lactifluus volemus]